MLGDRKFLPTTLPQRSRIPARRTQLSPGAADRPGMSPARLLAVLRQLRPEDHASSPDYACRVRLEWRILRALERRGLVRSLAGRAWTRRQLLDEAFALEEPPRGRPRLVLVVDNESRRGSARSRPRRYG